VDSAYQVESAPRAYHIFLFASVSKWKSGRNSSRQADKPDYSVPSLPPHFQLTVLDDVGQIAGWGGGARCWRLVDLLLVVLFPILLVGVLGVLGVARVRALFIIYYL